MMEFASLADLAQHLVTRNAVLDLSIEQGVELASIILQKEMKAEIGHYQDAIGPFPEWAELAESTKEDRLTKGYSENDPLLRSGGLYNSIECEANGGEAIAGSTSDIMPLHEFGTEKMPPRPVVGPALYRRIDEIVALIGKVSVSGLIGSDTIHSSLGYDMDRDGAPQYPTMPGL